MKKVFIHSISFVIEVLMLPIVLLAAFFFRLKTRKPFDIGLGPEPLINNYYHKKALELFGYTTQTFVNGVYVIFNKFDVRADLYFGKFFKVFFINYYLYFLALNRYRCLYIYFNGGPLGFTHFIWRIEPLLYKLANVKTIVLPYGSDVQEMSRSKNILFKNAMSSDYPMHKNLRNRIRKKIDIWTRHSNHVIGGCEWVDYMYHWDTLMLAHFSIDTDVWLPVENKNKSEVLKILHAPNHKKIKGTSHIIKAVTELQQEGYKIELIFREKMPNDQLKRVMEEVDVVADQLIVGWYAMFALEAMSMQKPVLCYLRDDLIELYEEHGLITRYEIPIINVNFRNLKEKLIDLCLNKYELASLGKQSREYVIAHHSLKYVGSIFNEINLKVGINN